MIRALKNYFWSRWLRKYGCKLASGISSMSEHSVLIFEEHVKLSRVLIKSRLIEIGAYSYLRSGCEIYGVGKIGRFCSIGANVIIGLEKNKHPSDWLSTSFFSKSHEKNYEEKFASETTVIGNDCWIGRDAIIMSGVNIGNGAIIGARSLITRDVPPYAVYAGSPARLLRFRFESGLIEKLLAAEWWNMPKELLTNLPVDEPKRCLDYLATSHAAVEAKYQKIRMTRRGARLLA